MASSRRSGRAEPGPVEAVRAALAPLHADARVVVAFSGGLDSTALLRAAVMAGFAGRVVAVHVDHGLQAGSDDWARRCRREAADLGVAFLTRRLSGAPAPGESTEAWAREARYAAIAELAREAGATVLLTAHHADDQIETFLLRLARGAGLDGLIGIEADARRLGLRLIRPFLGLSRRTIEAWARSQGLQWIDDPSNADESLLRNAIRRRLMPEIDRLLPSLRQRLPATLDSLREARELLREIEHRDLAAVAVQSNEFGLCLSLSGWRMLPAARRPGVLRRWLAMRGARMPSRVSLAEIVRQIGSPREDALVALRHDGWMLRRYRDLVALVPQVGSVSIAPHSAPIRWRGEGRIDCPDLGGALLVEPVEEAGRPGLRAEFLNATDLELRPRAGGERLRLRPGGPHRSLKNLFQEHSVPTWVRPTLPVLWSGGRPIWVPRLGADADCLGTVEARCHLEWISTI